MDTNKLKAKMLLYGDTGKNLSDFLDISRSTLSLKMQKSDKAEFTQGEISRIKERYNLSGNEIDEIFFN